MARIIRGGQQSGKSLISPAQEHKNRQLLSACYAALRAGAARRRAKLERAKRQNP